MADLSGILFFRRPMTNWKLERIGANERSRSTHYAHLFTSTMKWQPMIPRNRRLVSKMRAEPISPNMAGGSMLNLDRIWCRHDGGLPAPLFR